MRGSMCRNRTRDGSNNRIRKKKDIKFWEICEKHRKTLDKYGESWYYRKRPKQILWNKEESKMKQQNIMMMPMLMRMCSMCMFRRAQFGQLLSESC